MHSWTININGPIQILLIYQEFSIRDINQEWKGLGMAFFIGFIHNICRQHFVLKTIFLTLDNTTYQNKIHLLSRFFILSLQLMDLFRWIDSNVTCMGDPYSLEVRVILAWEFHYSPPLYRGWAGTLQNGKLQITWPKTNHCKKYNIFAIRNTISLVYKKYFFCFNSNYSNCTLNKS